jgi:KH domain
VLAGAPAALRAAVARARGGGEDKGRRFALSVRSVTAKPGDQGAGQGRREGHGVTDDSAFKKQVRSRMAETGEKYTVARRMVIAGRDPGQRPMVLRVYLNPHMDLELTDEAARAYAAADEPGRRDMANRLLAEHLEMAGSEEAGVAVGSEILTVQDLPIEQINDLIYRRIGRAAGVSAVAVSGDEDYVRVDIHATRPGVAVGHGGAEADRLRAELAQLIGKQVQLQLNILQVRPPKALARKEDPGARAGG